MFCTAIHGWSQSKMRKVAERNEWTIFETDGKEGFVVISNEETPAVLARTSSGRYEDFKENEAVKMLLDCAATSIREKRHNKAPALPPENSSTIKDSVPAMIHDLWTQEYPYNRMTPMIDGTHCVTGCVAQAMAQIMNYWNYPEHGTGYIEYDDSTGCKQIVSSNLEEHYYDWDNILDVYTEGEYTEKQADAVARLISDCGIAVHMKYGTISSGARSIYQATAMVNHFGYDRGMQIYYRDFFTWEEWDTMLKTELSAGRPMLISAQSPTLSHAFVCDGYDKDGLYHLIFGNGVPSEDIYYNIEYISPNQPKWYDKNSPERGMNLLQSVITGIQPATNANATNTEKHIYCFSEMKCTNNSIVVEDICNTGWNVHNDSVGIAIKDMNDRIVDIPYVYDRIFELEETNDTTYTDTIHLKIKSKLADGTYKIVPMYKDGEWKEARTSAGTPNYLLLSIENRKATIHADSSAIVRLRIADFSIPDALISKDKPQYWLSIKNETNKEYHGRFYLVLYEDKEKGKAYTLNLQGITIGAGETVTRDFVRTPMQIPVGKYTLRIFYTKNLFNSEIYMLHEQPISVINASSIQIAER